jgi:hypothetical protein
VPHTYQLKIEEKDAAEAKAKLEVEARAASEKVAAEKAPADNAAADAEVAIFSSVRICLFMRRKCPEGFPFVRTQNIVHKLRQS